MRLLADTHTFLWFVEGDPQLSPEARRLLEDPNNEILISMASIWEMAIKVSIGKLTLLTPDKPFEVHLTEQLQGNGFGILPITLPHIFVVANLPFHHRDPFDRIITAQSLVERIPLISIDAIMDAYGLHRLW
jgi:PIN domain nuclease of toxin-antitoxin system